MFDHLAKHNFHDMGSQVWYQTGMLFMQFTNVTAGSGVHLEKTKNIYISTKKNKLLTIYSFLSNKN